jgi:hypothetical protein
MLHSPQSFRIGNARPGFSRARPRVPMLVSVGVIAALIVALVVAGVSLTSELFDPATFEDGVDSETLVMSATVLVLTIGLATLFGAALRRYAGADRRKEPPLAA